MTTNYFASLSLAAALMAITLSSCDDISDSQASPAADGTTVICNLNVSYDSGIRSRAGDIVPGDGSDIVELSYVIRDVQGNTLYGTGLQDSPEPVKGAGGWNLSLPLTKGTDYSVLFCQPLKTRLSCLACATGPSTTSAGNIALTLKVTRLHKK